MSAPAPPETRSLSKPQSAQETQNEGKGAHNIQFPTTRIVKSAADVIDNRSAATYKEEGNALRPYNVQTYGIKRVLIHGVDRPM